ncbi:MAG: hypothetical protein BGP08_08705 [Rhizobiales bacterium 64-17]|nr:MAG: hypothetical protein BGP08_08705 [Rhizobiales bacterium 64-17]
MRPHKIIHLAEIQSYTGLRSHQIRELIKYREFPYPLKLGEGQVGWLESDISDWQANLIERREWNSHWL